MPRVSPRALKEDVQRKLFYELAQYIGKADRRNAPAFLEILLTPDEQIMLAKRIGVIALLHNDVSAYRIMQKLHMSSFTVSSMQKAYESGAYEPITKLFRKNKKDWIRFMKVLEVVLRGGLPPRVGHRWNLR